MYSHSCAVALRSPYLGLRPAATVAAVATRRTDRLRVQAAARYGTAGEVILHRNQLSLGREDPRLRRAKNCIDKAVTDTFDGHASVQHQGSTRKGTGLVDSSDWDFFVHLDNSIQFVTHKQRMAIVRQLGRLLPDAGIDYSMRCGGNRVFMWNGSDAQGFLPDVDVVFERFRKMDDPLVAPDSRALAHSPSAQRVVIYIKRLPVRFIQLPVPKSSLLEQLALQLQQQHFGHRLTDTAEGFEALLRVALTATAGYGDAAVHREARENAQVISKEWQGAAQFVLDRNTEGFGWLY